MNLDHQIDSFFQSAAGNLKLLVAQNPSPWSLQEYQRISGAKYTVQYAVEVLPPNGCGTVVTHILESKSI
ncbi:MAG: hypothetical protein LBJ95_03530 [Oscillospiraceae bacterium]|jgi:hypothetical protein|nr:hypothetical protein [Oscillospiraceae bacterium]